MFHVALLVGVFGMFLCLIHLNHGEAKIRRNARLWLFVISIGIWAVCHFSPEGQLVFFEHYPSLK